MNKKTKLIIIIALIAVVIAGAVTAIVLLGNNEQNPDRSTVIIWTDSTSPEGEPDPEVTSPAVVYPEKPANAPAKANTDLPVSVGDITASSEDYVITQEAEGVKIAYNSIDYPLTAYAYVYVPVENYHAKYSYLKINANCTGVQKISIIAVYYEQYDANRPGVTVYNNTVKEGENIILCDLSEPSILDEHYNVAIGEKLTQKQIIGFMIMIDSNPKQVIDDYVGEMLIKRIAVVDETDPD